MATFTKLRDGSWGIKLGKADMGHGRSGAVVKVQTKAGEVKSVTVQRVVAKGADYALCSIVSDRAPARSSSSRSYGGTLYGRRTGCSCGSIEGRIQDSDCWTCKHDAE